MSADVELLSEHDSSDQPDKTRWPVDLQWLDRQRALRGWTRKHDLADALDVRPATISDLYANGWTGAVTWAKLLKALKATPPDEMAVALMGESGEGAA
jgi:hypothetical protein